MTQPTAPLPDDTKHTSIDCAKCGRIILNNLGQHTISQLHAAAKAHSCPPLPPAKVTFLEYRQ